MIDNDGIERPDNPHEHQLPVKKCKKRLTFDDKYHYVIKKNPFFILWSGFLRFLAWCFYKPYCHIKYGLKIIGLKNFKKVKNTGYIVTNNHVHTLDVMMIGTCVLQFRKMYVTTLPDNIQRPIVGRFLRSFCCIPIADTMSGMKAFSKDVSYILKREHALVFCAEGALWPYYRKIRPFKRGAFQFAVANDVPILPMVILFRKRKFSNKPPFKMTIVVGEPIYKNNELKTKNEQITDLLERTQTYYKNIAEKHYTDPKNGFVSIDNKAKENHNM